MTQENATERICYTDGWHPTVNPSSRMVMHHFRFVELLHSYQGILNEFPRRRGGCTIRLLRFNEQGFHVQELPTLFEFVPWWLPATPFNAQSYLFPCYEQTLQMKDMLMPQEVAAVGKLLASLKTLVHSSDWFTLGEVLNLVNEQQYREILPEMPSLHLISLTRDPLRHLFAQTLRSYMSDSTLEILLSAWSIKSNTDGFTMLAVGHTREENLYRVSWSQREKNLAIVKFDPMTGKSLSQRIPADASWLADQLDAGLLIPGSRLTSLLEVLLHSEGKQVLHFGNNYGRVREIATILSEHGFSIPFSPQEITLCEDDADSWHVGIIEDHIQSYPLHLLEMMCIKPETQTTLHRYVHYSLEHSTPAVLTSKGSLDETISAGRA